MGSALNKSEGKILVVDDEPRVLRLVSEVLKAVGYEVIAVGSVTSAMETLVMERPNLVLLDVLLGDGPTGYDICRRIREFSDVAIIMLTAKATEADVLAGFEAGADDYLTKPFSARELIARVGAVLRRTGHPEEAITSTHVCGGLEINFAQRTVKKDGKIVPLTRTEYALLRELALHPNCVMSHVQLLTSVWGPEYRDDVDYLRAYIRYLRRKLEHEPSTPFYILTRPGVGYMLACPDVA